MALYLQRLGFVHRSSIPKLRKRLTFYIEPQLPEIHCRHHYRNLLAISSPSLNLLLSLPFVSVASSLQPIAEPTGWSDS